MKIVKIIVLILVTIYCNFIYSQTSTCSSSLPFCAGLSGTTFPATPSGNGSAQAGPNYGCLSSQPSPAWYFFQVSQNGNIDIGINGTGGGDVDFICWGPFSSPTGNCSNLTAGNTVDCSFSARATETCNISGAIAGQYYMLLITNYSGQVQNINFNQIGGTGATNCSLLSGVSSQSICAGQTATLTANSNLSAPSYAWNSGGATASILVTPTVTTVYTVSISGNDPAGTATTIVASGTVTVYQPPTVSLTSNNKVCPTSPITFTATPGLAGYSWIGPPALSQTTSIGSLSIPNANASKMGVYTVVARSVQGCTAAATTTVDLVPTANVVVTPGYTVCQGGEVNLIANALGAVSYDWVGPSAYVSALQSPTISNIPLNQAGTYTVTASFVSGPTTCITKNTSAITIIPAAPVALNPIPAICNNASINLMAPNGGNTYYWNGPNAFVSNTQNPTISNAGTINQGVYTLTIVTNGCINTGSVNVGVYNALSFVNAPADITLCMGKTAQLSTTGGAGGSGAYNYAWTPVTDLSDPTMAVTTVTGNATTTYTLIVTDANCAITVPASAVAIVSVNPIPVITFSTSNARGCEPFYTDLVSSSVPASNNCSWTFSKNLSVAACSTNPFCFPTHGSYDAMLTVTDVNGCVDSLKQSAFVLVDPKPLPDFDWFPENPTILINDVGFTDQSTVGLPMQTWDWNFGDLSVSSASNIANVASTRHIYNTDGNYLVTLSVKNSFGCVDSVKKIVKVENEFVLYIPNAFTPIKNDGNNDVFNVKGMGLIPETFEMTIYDRWGTPVFKTHDIDKGWDGKINGNMGTQDVYVYKIRVKDYNSRVKEFVGHVTLL
jgi:gliding motility-associated-like protein